MIVSGMNFVNNYKFSDFILTKITEEQEQLDSVLAEKDSELDEKQRSSTNTSSGGASSCSRVSAFSSTTDSVPYDDCVTIATHDGYFLSVDHSSLQVSMKKDSEIREPYLFRRVFLERTSPKRHLIVLQSLAEPSYYLATTQERHLELQSYCADTLGPDIRDERVFTVHEINSDTVFIQPYAHKAQYLHHLDSVVTVRPLDINFRPPEEFFMKIDDVKQDVIRELQRQKAAPPMSKDEVMALSDAGAPDPKATGFSRKGSKKLKVLTSPVTPKPGFLSCFGIKLKKKDKNKR